VKPIEKGLILKLLEESKSNSQSPKQEKADQQIVRSKDEKQSPTGKSGKISAQTKATGLSAETILAGVDQGLIDWDQVVFNKETLIALEENMYTLDQN
jgi:hypothetical protein